MKKYEQEKAEQEKRRQELIAKTDPAIIAEIEKSIEAMDRYVGHVLKDLKAASNNLPEMSIDTSDMRKGLEWTKEIANTPYKTIEEWTGILFETLPDEGHLTGDQIERLVGGIDELWDAWYWMFDLNEQIDHPVIRYRMYLDCWMDNVQYLPNLGFEIELCNGSTEGCRMGEDCICLYDPPNIEFDESPSSPSNDSESLDLPF